MPYNDLYIYTPIGRRSEEHPDNITAIEVVQMLSWIEDSQVVVHVNCPGGTVTEGMAIFEALNGSDKPITVIVEGIAASMASVVMLAGDEIIMTPYARIMTHCIKGESKGSAATMRADAATIEQFEATMLIIYSQRTGLTVEECRLKFLTEEDTWFTAEEALALGLCDRIKQDNKIKPEPTLAVNDAYAFYQTLAAVLKVPNQKKDMDFEKLKNALQLGADVTEEAFLNQVADWRTKAMQVEGLNAKLAGFEQAASQAESARIDALIAKAVKDKRITAIAVPVWKNLFTVNAENAAQALEAISPARDLTQFSATGTPGEREQLALLTFDQLDRSNKLERCRAEFYDLYEAKFEEKFGKKPNKQNS